MIIVDTDILIDAARCIEDAVNCLQQIEDKSSLAIIANIQLISKNQKDYRFIEELDLLEYPVLNL